MKIEMNKKGVIENLAALVVPLIGIGLVLVVGFLIFDQAKVNVLDRGPATSITNESITTYTTGSFLALTLKNCMAFSCSELRNGSDDSHAVVSATRYNCTTRGIQINNNTADNFNETLYLDYSCTNKTSAWNATSDVQNATQDIPGWLPIIIITVIGALLIGLVTRFRGQ